MAAGSRARALLVFMLLCCWTVLSHADKPKPKPKPGNNAPPSPPKVPEFLAAKLTRVRSPRSYVPHFVTEMLVGEPPSVPVDFTVDTMARTTAIPQSLCTKASPVPCDHPICHGNKLDCDESRRQCFWRGHDGAAMNLVTTGVSMQSADGRANVTASGIAVTCADPPYVSLSATNTSLVAQLGSGKFAYCLGKPRGALFLGRDAGYNLRDGRSLLKSLRYVPLVESPQSWQRNLGYRLPLRGVAIGFGSKRPTPLPIAPDAFRLGAVISTMARYTSLVDPAYQLVRRQFRRAAANAGANLTQVPSPFPELNLCYQFPSVNTSVAGAPRVLLLFTNNVTVTVEPRNYIVRWRSTNVVCLGIVSAGPLGGVSVIGTLQQEETLVEIDLDKRRVGFTDQLIKLRSSCEDLDVFGWWPKAALVVPAPPASPSRPPGLPVPAAPASPASSPQPSQIATPSYPPQIATPASSPQAAQIAPPTSAPRVATPTLAPEPAQTPFSSSPQAAQVPQPGTPSSSPQVAPPSLAPKPGQVATPASSPQPTTPPSPAQIPTPSSSPQPAQVATPSLSPQPAQVATPTLAPTPASSPQSAQVATPSSSPQPAQVATPTLAPTPASSPQSAQVATPSSSPQPAHVATPTLAPTPASSPQSAQVATPSSSPQPAQVATPTLAPQVATPASSPQPATPWASTQPPATSHQPATPSLAPQVAPPSSAPQAQVGTPTSSPIATPSFSPLPSAAVPVSYLPPSPSTSTPSAPAPSEPVVSAPTPSAPSSIPRSGFKPAPAPRQSSFRQEPAPGQRQQPQQPTPVVCVPAPPSPPSSSDPPAAPSEETPAAPSAVGDKVPSGLLESLSSWWNPRHETAAVGEIIVGAPIPAGTPLPITIGAPLPDDTPVTPVPIISSSPPLPDVPAAAPVPADSPVSQAPSEPGNVVVTPAPSGGNVIIIAPGPVGEVIVVGPPPSPPSQPTATVLNEDQAASAP